MKIIRAGRRSLLFIMALHFVFMGSGVAADVEGLLAEINRKPPEERRKILTDGAKKERVVYYYGSTSMATCRIFSKASTSSIPLSRSGTTDWGAPALVSKISHQSTKEVLIPPDIRVCAGHSISRADLETNCVEVQKPFNPISSKRFRRP